MVRFASIGTSSIVDLFARSAALVDQAEYRVACSRDLARANEFGAQYGARGVGELQELARCADVDAVYVASPNVFHHEQARLLLNAGKHVLVEKSACANAEQWLDLLQLAEQRGVLLLESVRSVHEPSWRAVTAYLDSLGPVRQVELHLCQRSRRYDNFLAGRIENIFKPEMAAGALMDLGVYSLHPLMTLFGLPTRVRASSVKLSNGIDGATTLLLDYPGFTATVSASKISANSSWNVIAGEDASLEIDKIDDPQQMRIWWAHSQTHEDLDVRKEMPQQAYVLQAFARMVADPTLARPHQEATLNALTVMDEARRQVGLRFPGDPDDEHDH
ncbi:MULTISPECIES: Gfo/Idh/MocA family protein [unclassified Luteococcus]|uniref:Gfo/Idh/MocA family protein n=1 Tax=unclassified Luteococcus TaxID=2639923 RepID=UPI00313C68AE